MNFFAFSSLLTTFISIILIVIIISFGKSKIHRIWAFCTLAISIWGFGTYLAAKADSPKSALFAWRLAFSGALYISVFFYHLVCIFGNLTRKKTLFFVYTQAIFFHIVTITTEKVFVNWHIVFNSLYYNKATVFYYLTATSWLTVVFLGHYELWQIYKKARGFKRIQTIYLLSAFSTGFLGGFLCLSPAVGINLYPCTSSSGALYAIIVTYAILKYRLMDIKLALTRAGIFAVVYFPVAFIPFWIAPKFIHAHLWWIPVFLMGILATLGIFIYNELRKRAEDLILREERHAHQLLKQAAEGMMRYRSIKELLDLMVHITTKTLKLENAAVFLIKENSASFNLSAVRFRSRYHYLEVINGNDPLIQQLSFRKAPLVYEEVKLKAQEQKDKPDDPIHEIESQMRRLSCAVIVPAILRDRLIGFLSLGEKISKRMYSPEDLATLWAISYQAALAIENALLYEKEKTWLAQASKRETLAEMAPGASHQFNNRLIAISSTAENLLDLIIKNGSTNLSKEELIETVSADLKIIIAEVMKGKQITEAILQKAKVKLEFDRVDIIKVIQNAIKLTQLRRTQESLRDVKESRFVFNYPRDLPLLILCESLIQDVFENLFNNAIDAIVIKDQRKTEPLSYQGRITIDVLPQNKSLTIQIEDNGIGIPKENLDKLFTPYFTTKATSEKGVLGGFGLGLWVMRDFIERQGGSISVESEHAQWTRFTITLPIDFKPPK